MQQDAAGCSRTLQDAAGCGRELQRIAEQSSAILKKKQQEENIRTPGSKLPRARLVTSNSGTGCIQK